MSYKFIGAVLVLATGMVLQLISGEVFGIWINFSLAALLATAFFLDLSGTIVLILLAVFILNSQPAFSPELLVFALLPLLAFALREFLPWHRWVSVALFAVLGLAAFYVIFGWNVVMENTEVFLVDMLGTLAFSQLSFFTIRKLA